MKKFIVRVLLFILPFILVSIDYLVCDPFRVLYKYNDYSKDCIFTLNRDYVSTEVFMNNYKKQGYNSFIFGDSKTLAFKPSSWQKYLSPTDSPFLFDASNESVYGIYLKIKYLDAIHVKIDNALILCASFSHSEDNDHTGCLFMKHPILTEKNRLHFQFEFLKAFLHPMLFLSFHDYKLTKKYKSYMYEYIEHNQRTTDPITNEVNLIGLENEILNTPEKYYEDRKNIFYERESEKTDTIQKINPKQLYFLTEIKRILEKHNTKYRVVLAPGYSQTKFNPDDKETLINLYGNRVYDFSGKNSFTDNKTNYYETSHYRPVVGDSILMQIYRN